METAAPSLNAYLDAPIVVGEPDVAGPLAVFPLFGAPATFEYQSLAQGGAHGVSVKELPGGASVNDLIVTNPTGLPVLLFEGEEVLGAQQNRTFDVSILVGAQSTLRAPVSCVEAGRWDGRRHNEDFTPAPQAAYPSLRRLKNEAVHASLAAGMEARADQDAVWKEVDHKLDSLAVVAPTRAMHDGYEARRRELAELTGACGLKPEQTGMLVAIGGEFTVLDRVSQPLVLASLYEPLVQGYALDAFGVVATDVEPPSVDQASEFVESVLATPTLERDGLGLGRDVRLSRGRATGAGVVCADELVQLSVFAVNGRSSDAQLRSARIRRPSRRRRH
jgi:hypothetical protein